MRVEGGDWKGRIRALPDPVVKPPLPEHQNGVRLVERFGRCDGRPMGAKHSNGNLGDQCGGDDMHRQPYPGGGAEKVLDLGSNAKPQNGVMLI